MQHPLSGPSGKPMSGAATSGPAAPAFAPAAPSTSPPTAPAGPLRTSWHQVRGSWASLLRVAPPQSTCSPASRLCVTCTGTGRARPVYPSPPNSLRQGGRQVYVGTEYEVVPLSDRTTAVPLNNSEIASLTWVLKAVASPVRLLLLQAPVGQERSVGELAEQVGAPYAAVFQHLARLRAAGLVAECRGGRRVLHCTANPHLPPRTGRTPVSGAGVARLVCRGGQRAGRDSSAVLAPSSRYPDCPALAMTAP
ncbi:metalloregulator ArsR/SmtB family transcription factor [Streptomyces noursei]|uniref:ArsR/SmtB family transcription factor n=1 Tax=Streptomyces noursei TaxID=1971 RepID=UPI00294FFFD6|nr:metalloregulator ArsR/SmtB family transcription factor [Streptomyces noursei]